jgi:hypothetical protein
MAPVAVIVISAAVEAVMAAAVRLVQKIPAAATVVMVVL